MNGDSHGEILAYRLLDFLVALGLKSMADQENPSWDDIAAWARRADKCL